MQKNDIREALYGLPDVEIVQRRKPLTTPLLMFFVGAVLLIANALIDSTAETANLKSALVLLGIIPILIGGVIMFIRLSGSDNAPYHTGDGCFLRKKELRFNKDKRTYIAALIEKGDFATLHSMKQDGVSAIWVVIYSSPKSAFCAAQAFEYVELERRPICKLTYR